QLAHQGRRSGPFHRTPVLAGPGGGGAVDHAVHDEPDDEGDGEVGDDPDRNLDEPVPTGVRPFESQKGDIHVSPPYGRQSPSPIRGGADHGQRAGSTVISSLRPLMAKIVVSNG